MTRTAALLLAACALTAGAAQARPPQQPRPKVAVTVLTLDDLRQFQARHGRSALDVLGDARWGRFDFAGPALETVQLASCEDEGPDRQLDYCVRYYLTRAERPADAPPAVVVVFDDRASDAPHHRSPGEMRVLCYGRGVTPADPGAQDTWLWPGSARLRGVRDWERDLDALAVCIEAAASEPWTGLREPD